MRNAIYYAETTAGVSRRCPPLRGLQPLTSLSKGLKVLLKLREATEPLSLSEISRALRLNKVTALRLLVTLEKFRFVEKDPQHKKYRIGSNAFHVGSGFLAEDKQKKISQVNGKSSARPEAHDYFERTGRLLCFVCGKKAAEEIEMFGIATPSEISSIAS